MAVSEKSQRTADEQERDRAAVAALALAWFWDHQDELVARIKVAVATGKGFEGIVQAVMDELTEQLAYAGVAAWSQARIRVAANVAKAVAVSPALRKLFPKDVRTYILEQLEAASEPEKLLAVFEEEAKVFTDTLAAFLNSHLRQGMTPEEVEAALEASGLAGGAYSIVSIYNTFTHDIYTDALRTFNVLEPVKSIFFGFEYVTMRDTRVRPTHRAADSLVAVAGDRETILRFAKLLADWGCRCTLVALYAVPGSKPKLV